jgi:hypothetical protein
MTNRGALSLLIKYEMIVYEVELRFTLVAPTEKQEVIFPGDYGGDERQMDF